MNGRPTQQVFRDLEKRLGSKHLRKRLRFQVRHSAIKYARGGFNIQWENAKPIYSLLGHILKIFGLLDRGSSNALNYNKRELRKRFNNLPESFRNIRLLHLSDIHIEGIADKGDRLKEEIKKMEFDLCVITGDFRFRSFHDYGEAISDIAKIVDVLQCKYGIFGVLGNHDFIEMVPDLEELGIKILLNESAKIEKGDECIWIVGVDDSSTFNVHDLNKSLQEVPSDAFKILLAHSPDIFYDAASHMFDYYLCGHTHGGQICLPGGIPIITNASCPRDYIAGSWKFGKMEGYTSAGTGSSGLFVRFFCPPEITIHQLT